MFHSVPAPQKLRFDTIPELVPALTAENPRYIALHGGRGGTKSYFCADYVIAQALAGKRCLCLREVQLSLEQSSKQLIEDEITRYGLHHEFRILKTHIESAAGGRIDFKGMQNYNAANIKSLEGYDVAWWEEAHTASQYSLDILTPTIRKPGSVLLFSWNPEDPEDPVDSMFRGPNPVSNAIVIRVGWKNNPWLPDVLRAEKDDLYRRDPEKASWVWGGEYRTISEAQILRGMYEARVFTPQPGWDGPYQGLDFGFANDPTMGVRLWVAGKELYVEYAAGTAGLDIDLTERYMLERIPNWDKFTTRCDSARPETISYMNRHGAGKYVGVEKWKGSVEDGIAWYRSFDKIIVHTENARPFLRECKLYSYKTNKAGDILPQVEDKDNHAMDAGRYAGAPLIKAASGPRIRSL